MNARTRNPLAPPAFPVPRAASFSHARRRRSGVSFESVIAIRSTIATAVFADGRALTIQTYHAHDAFLHLADAVRREILAAPIYCDQ